MKLEASRAVLSGYLRVRRFLPAPVNVLFWVAVIASAVGTAAMILILSVFAGFGELVESLFSAFYPDVRITVPAPARGEDILASAKPLIAERACVIEQQAVLQFGERQTVVQLIEIDSAYWQMAMLDSFLYSTFPALVQTDRFILLGTGVAYMLAIENSSLLQPQIRLLLPDTSRLRSTLSVTAGEIFTEQVLPAGGTFTIQRDIDLSYAIVVNRTPMQECPVIYLRAVNEHAIPTLAKILKSACPACTVTTRYEEHAMVYRIIMVERLAVAIILGGVFLLCLFTIGALVWVLVVVKKPDIKILRAIGMKGQDVASIFTGYGTAVGIAGMALGVATGLALAWIQKTFGIVKLSGQTFVVKEYPVAFSWSEYVIVCVFVGGAALALSWLAGRRSTLIQPTFREL